MVVSVKTGHSTERDEEKAILEAVGEPLKELDGQISFVVLFASSNYNPKKLMKAYNAIEGTKGISMIGCTTAGEMSEKGFSRGGITAFFLASNYVRAASSVVKNLSRSPLNGGKKLVKDALKKLDIKFNLASTAYLKKKPTTMLNYNPVFIMPLLDGLFSRPEDAMEGILQAAGSFTPIIGGVAGDDGRFKKTYQFCDGKVYTNSMVGLAINSDLKIGFGYAHGYTPTKKKAIVTKAKGRFVYKINDKPALDEYARLIGVPVEELKRDWSEYAVKHPLAVRDLRETPIMKYAMEPTSKGALSCAADIPEDTTVVLMQSKKQTIAEASQVAIKDAMKDSESTSIAGAIIFDCVCRGAVLGDDGANKQVKYINKTLKAPFAGFETYGEEGYFGLKYGSTIHHNETMLVVVFSKETIAN